MRVKGKFCVGCPLEHKGIGFVPPPDVTSASLLICGEAPGTQEVQAGIPFVGPAGHWLWNNILGPAGISRDAVAVDNSLRCLPPVNKQDEHYPIGKEKEDAERYCANYDRYREFDTVVPLLLLGGKSLRRHTGLDNISDYHGTIELRDGRLVGCTFHPAAVMRQVNLLPVAVKEAANLVEAARNPGVILERPVVWKGQVLPPDEHPKVIDLEWSPAQEITVVGMASDGQRATSTFSVEQGLAAIKAHPGCLAGHNLWDADFPVMNWYPDSYKPARVFDTLIAGHLVHAHLAELGLLGLGDLCRFYRPTSDWKQDKADVLEYNGRDCAYNYRLYEDLKADLEATDQMYLMEKQQKLAHMTTLMRQRGIRVNVQAIEQYETEFNRKKDRLKAGFPFNPNSSQQVTAWAKKQGIALPDNTIRSIERMAGEHPVISQLAEYKQQSKTIKVWFNQECREKGRIHPSFNVTGTAVARFSCSGPNCQNCPPYLRHIILPEEGEELVSADFSQIENRCIAWLAKDDKMLADFAAGGDIHATVAGRILGKADVTREERQTGKITVHATNYGETAFNLAERLYGSRGAAALAKARGLQGGYFSAYPRTREWQQEVAKGLDSGDIMLRNPFGRARFIYARNSHERMKRGCHFLGCSTAADIVNGKVIMVWEELGLLPILIVHDEAVYSLPVSDQQTRSRIKQILEAPVPELDGMVIPVKVKRGPNYGGMT